ncbi:hypothetical protein N5J06_03945 [Ralstonia sp. CHL-2022]|uniref:Uncharacterized protein n=1 Tax=Ralstonia mojiangensis TaxID=2953895 RepID=A0ABT2L562_9RALS|nr:hypothetical protein [Ralstonia mojiangensis]MCT7310082.1 hypothetical protein [Ralstonia mojiangensis]
MRPSKLVPILFAVLSLVSSNAMSKSPEDKLLDVLMGEELGSERDFTCTETIDGKVTDTKAYLHFGSDNNYRRSNSYTDKRTGFAKLSSGMRGSFDVFVSGGTARIEFTEKYISDFFLEPALKYRATVAVEGSDHIVLTMKRPVPRDGSGVTDNVRLDCIGDAVRSRGSRLRAY